MTLDQHVWSVQQSLVVARVLKGVVRIAGGVVC